jgi:hypothetical protein
MYSDSLNKANGIVPEEKIITFTYFCPSSILNIPIYTRTRGSYIVEICTTRKYGTRYTVLEKPPVPEIIDTVFAKTSPKRSFSMTEYECFGLVFTKTRVYKFGHRSMEEKSIIFD